jgi:peptide-methionine (R)-S-oxide reductase
MPTIPAGGPLAEAAAANDAEALARGAANDKPTASKVQKTGAEWRTALTPEQYHVLREKGTERPYTGVFTDHHADGMYHCAACDAALFSSQTKFDSGCGWPSFYAPIDSTAVDLHEDRTLGMRRVEVTCAQCGGHLGHVFPDGPKPTGERFCINSVSLGFEGK